MKSLSNKKIAVLTCDDLPLPLVIHRQDTGEILKFNLAAKKLFGFKGKTINIKRIRPEGLPKKSFKANGFVDYGTIPHRTHKGKDLNMIVLRKLIAWNEKACWADFLEPVHDNLSIKNQLTQSSLDAIISFDEKQKVYDWNPAAEKIFGWKKLEAVNKKLAELIIPTHYKKSRQEDFIRLLKSGNHKILNRLIETKVRHKKGDEFLVELTITPVQEAGKRLYYAFVRNISIRKEIERKQLDVEKKLNRAQAIANLGSWEMYGNFNEIHWSDQFYRLHGLEPQSVKPSTKLRLSMTHPLDREKLQKAIEQAAKQGKPYSIEKRIIRPDGETRWILSEGEATVDENGKRKVFGTLLDITERKKIEEALQRANAGLSETLIFGKMGSAELDLTTFKLIVSRELLHLLDVNVTEAQSMSLNNFLNTYIHRKYLALIHQKIEEGMSANIDFKKVVEVEFQMVTATNRTIWIEAKGIFKGGTALGILQDITARKKSEEELAVKNATIQNMLKGITDGIFAVDRNLNFTLVSPVFARLANIEVDDMIGKNMLTLFPFMKDGKLHDIYKEAIQTQKATSFEFQSSINAEQVFEINVYPNPDGLFIYYKDISDRVVASKALSESHRLLRRLSANVPGMIYNFYLDDSGKGVFEYVSEGSLNLLGITANDLMHDGNLIFSKVHPDDLPRVQDSIKLAVNNQQSWAAEFRILVNNDVEKWISAASTPYQETNGRNLWYGFMHDISEIKRAHQQISNVTDTIPDGFIYEYWQNRDGSDYKINYISQGCERLFEVKMEDALKKADALFSIIHPDDITPFFKLVEEKRKRPGKFDIDYRVVMPDGRVKWVNGRANVRHLPDQSTIIEGIALDITRQKTLEHDEQEAKEKLHASENNLRAILNASTDFTVFLDTNGTVRLANAQAYNGIKLLVEHNLRIGDAFDELLPDNLRSRFKANFMHALAGEVIDTDHELQLTNTNISWLQLRYLPVRNDSGNIIGVSFNATNITARKHAELALKQSEERFKLLYNNTPAMLHSIDREGKLIRVSDYWLHKTGYTREEVIGRHVVEFLTEASRKLAFEKVLPQFFSTGELKNVEYDFVTKTGSVLNTLLSASSERDEGGNIIKSLAVVTDISDKKKLEGEISKLALIANKTSNAVVLTDVEGHITWVNDGFERITEYTRDEVIGKKPGQLLQGAETNRATIEYMRRCIKAGHGFKVELLNYTKSKKEYWLDIEVMPVHDDDGKLTGFMAIESDITQLKLAISEMLNSQTRLQTVMNNTPMVVFMKDLQGRYTFYNYAYQKSRSHTHLQSGHTDFDLFDGETANFLKQKDEQAVSMNLPVSFEHTINGRQFYTIVFPILNVKERMYALGGVSVDITERKQAEQALMQSEANLKSVFENSDTAYVLLDREFNILSFNQLAGHILTKMANQPVTIGAKALDFVADIRKQAIVHHLNNTLSGTRTEYETPFTIEGQPRWLHIRFFPVFNNKEVTGVIFAMSDITARKTAETEIVQSRERLKLVSDNLPSVAIYQYEVQPGEWSGQYKYYSVGVEQITGISVEALLQNPDLFEKKIHPDDWEEKQRILKLSFNSLSVFTQDYRFSHSSGQWKWLRTRSQPTRLADGRMIWNGLIIDITEQKQAEQVRQLTEARLRSIIQTEPNCVKVLNNKGELIDMNAAGLSMIEAENLDVVRGQRVSDIVDAPFRDQFNQLTQAVLKGQSGFLQFSITGLKGTKRWLETRAVPLPDPQTEQTLLLGITRDITVERDHQEKLLASLREKELLIKEIHHRVKNNLQLISSILYIRMVGMKQGDVKMFLEETRQKIRSIALIHERLLQTESVNQVDIADYLNKLILDLQMTTLSHDRKINLEANIESANMNLDMAINCGLILNELITNAAKHAFVNRSGGDIRVSLKRVDNKFEFIVEDDGCGMPESIQLGAGGFGMQVLDVFIKQLKAIVEIERVSGTRFKMIF